MSDYTPEKDRLACEKCGRPVCAKCCGTGVVGPIYHRGDTGVRGCAFYDQRQEGEHLHWYCPCGWNWTGPLAARAVLEEEKNGKSDAKFIEANRDYWFQKFEREQAELAELKRRVERALKESRDSVCNYPCPHYSCETHTRYAQILEGKDKP